MSAITWVEAVPSGTSAVGQAPDWLRSVWTSTAVGLATDLYWDGSGGASAASRGLLHPGASRTYVAAQSASSNNATSQLARAFWASDTSRLLLYDSAGTFLGGTPFFVEYRGVPGGDFHHPFLALSGCTRVSNATTAAVSRVTVLSLPTPSSTHTRPFGATVHSSDRSLLVRAVVHTTVVPSTSNVILEYRATTNGGSTATLYWHTVLRAPTDFL